MNNNPYIGRTVALTRLPAEVNTEGSIWLDAEISGLWQVDSFEAEDREGGVPADRCILVRVVKHPVWQDSFLEIGEQEERILASNESTKYDNMLASVDPEALIEQIDPRAHMASLDRERLMDEMSFWDDDRLLLRDCVYGQPIQGVRLREGVVA